MAYFTNLKEVAKYLKGNNEDNIKSTLWPKYYLHYLPQSTDTKQLIRIEEINGGYFGTRFGAKYRPVGSIDLSIKTGEQTAEIDWWMINDELHDKWTPGLYAPILSKLESQEMRQLLLSYAENQAKKHECNKIKRDVHKSLNEYNHSLKENGFILTNDKADDNSYWLKTYKYI